MSFSPLKCKVMPKFTKQEVNWFISTNVQSVVVCGTFFRKKRPVYVTTVCMSFCKASKQDVMLQCHNDVL